MRRIFGFLLMLLGSSGYHSAMAQSTGSFKAAGNMTMPRAGHTATLLPNGKVLIAGGSSSATRSEAVTGAEIYDPSDGTFIQAGNMTTARLRHTATPLPDGRILIAGGLGSFDNRLPAVATAELYDPVTGRFAATGSMIAGKSSNTATLLNNGKVLITGGPRAELYDPATGLFTATGPYAGRSAESVSTATLLPDGRVLFAGWSGNCEPTELYDPVTGTFSATGPMTGCDNVYTAGTLLMDGKVLFAGNIESNYVAAAEVFDPATGTFTPLEGAPVAAVSTFTLLPDGTVLIAGGVLPGGGGGPLASIYDSTTGKFAFAGEMTIGRAVNAATLLSDGTVLITGGFGPRPPSVGLPTTEIFVLASAEIYKPFLLRPAPALLALSGDGRGQGAILHARTARVVTASDPGVPGEVLEIYSTGLQDGSVIPPQVAIGGRLAEILYFGNAPGFIGLNQVNVRVPSGVPQGPDVPVRLNYLGRPSNAVTIGVQ
ncbi:MAG: hypothetical protein JJE04_10305 [Acidobacteriia bacterium]|nr:hypothetical protein [Terriglobia bacterium]